MRPGAYVVAGVVCIALITGWWLRESPPVSGPIATTPSTAQSKVPPRPPRARSTDENQSLPGIPDAELVENSIEDAFVLFGRVIDAQSGHPLPGVTVAAIEPIERHWTSEDDLAAGCAFLDEAGQVAFASAPWPALVEIESARGSGRAVNPEVESGRVLTRVIDRPSVDQEAMDAIETNRSGEFQLLVPGRGGVIRYTRVGYAPRFVPVRSRANTLVALDRARTLAGRVVDTYDRGIPDLPLRFFSPIGVDTWTTMTQSDGSFTLPIDGTHVIPKSLDPRWQLECPTPIVRLDDLATGSGELLLVAGKIPQVRVTDATTGDPVTRVSLLVRSMSGQVLLKAGELSDPEGVYPTFDYRVRGARYSARIAAWAPGYLTTTVQVPSLHESDTLDVSLRPGTSPSLVGQVTHGGDPVGDLTIALRVRPPTASGPWRVTDTTLLETTRTDAHGTFRFSPPPGRFLVQCFGEGTDRCAEVEIPQESRLNIDLSQAGSVSVRVTDSSGAPVPSLPLVLQLENGRKRTARTNREGQALFTDLVPGRITVATAQNIAGNKLWETPNRVITRIAAGAHEDLQLVAKNPADDRDPRYLRLEVIGIPGPQGWTVLDDATGLWLTLGVDGTIPIDLTSGGILTFRDTTGRRFHELVARNPSPEHVIRIEVDLDIEAAALVGYRFILVDSDNGRALDGVTVEAIPVGASGDSKGDSIPVAGVSNHRGQLDLLGLPATRHALHFRTPDRAGIAFEPNYDPQPESVPLLLAVPRRGDSGIGSLPNRVLRARVLDSNEDPAAGVIVQVSAIDFHTAGRWIISGDDYSAVADDEGRIELIVPSAPSYHAILATDTGDPTTWKRVSWSTSDRDSMTLRLDVKVQQTDQN